MAYQCIECGCEEEELYKDFNAGVIKVSHCRQCLKVVDKYIEYDSVMIFLDALLHKPQAYRHILYNSAIHAPWKLLLIFLLCDTYLKWDSVQSGAIQPGEDHIFYAALEWNFYVFFLLSCIEWFTFCTATLVLCQALCYYSGIKSDSNRPYIVTKALAVSSFGKLLAIPVIIWGQSNSIIYLWLTRLFIFTSNISALQVLFGFKKPVLCLLLVTTYTLQFSVGHYCKTLLTDVGS